MIGGNGEGEFRGLIGGGMAEAQKEHARIHRECRNRPYLRAVNEVFVHIYTIPDGIFRSAFLLYDLEIPVEVLRKIEGKLLEAAGAARLAIEEREKELEGQHGEK